MDADGRNERRLTVDGSLIQSHGWFPDGERILFSSDREGDLNLYEMRADGTGLRKLAAGFNGNVSPDGQWIAFLTRNGEIPDLNVMRTDGSGAKTLWPDAGGTPSWAPDSRCLAFVAISRDPQLDGIAVLDRDGNDFRVLLHPGWDPHEPSWSPDGTKIILSGLDQIFVMDADGQNLQRITKEFPGISSEPSWTSDNRIVYLEAGDWRIMRADGSDARTFLKYKRPFSSLKGCVCDVLAADDPAAGVLVGSRTTDRTGRKSSR
jgi:Tol biopolymer transport system component